MINDLTKINELLVSAFLSEIAAKIISGFETILTFFSLEMRKKLSFGFFSFCPPPPSRDADETYLGQNYFILNVFRAKEDK